MWEASDYWNSKPKRITDLNFRNLANNRTRVVSEIQKIPQK